MALAGRAVVDGRERRFTIGDLVVDADLTRSAFLATDVGRAAPTIVVNEPWCSWSFQADIDGERWYFGLYFEGEELMLVDLEGAGDGRFGEPWAPETEAARKRYHDDALARWGLGGHDVFSVIDPKEGSAGVLVRYRW